LIQKDQKRNAERQGLYAQARNGSTAHEAATAAAHIQTYNKRYRQQQKFNELVSRQKSKQSKKDNSNETKVQLNANLKA